jgi:hypothetical protein
MARKAATQAGPTGVPDGPDGDAPAHSVIEELTMARALRTAMATRQRRIDDFIHEGEPAADQPFELLCEDHVGSYVIPFPCRWSNGAWQSVETGSQIEATVIGWRAR